MQLPARRAVGVAIVEDDDAYRTGLGLLVQHTPGYVLAAEFGDAADAVAAAEAGAAAAWDLVLMDLEMPRMDGIAGVARLRALRSELSIVVLTVFEEPSTVVRAICAGADGYLLKRTANDDILAQMSQVLTGGSPLSAAVARTVLAALRAAAPRTAAAAPVPLLSRREHSVLCGLVDGRSYKQVAADLGIGIDTVRTYVRSLYRKLRVHSVSEAVTRALREGLVA
jgi:two-component system, NarL family, nitrate/nitrite response regulator NarL